VEREVAGGNPPLEDRERRAAVGARERPRLRHGDVNVLRGLGEGAEERRRHEGQVGRKDDDELGAGEAKCGSGADDRRAHVAPVVEHLEGELQAVGGLADDDDVADSLCQGAMRPLGERLPLVERERLRRPEAYARAADEERARYVSIRQGSE